MSRGIKWGIAKPVWYDGIRFASKAEMRRYVDLRLLERAGHIRDLEVQPAFPIEVINIGNGEATQVGVYKADFRYFNVDHGGTVVEDVKGMSTVVYRLKKRLVEALYGIRIQEIR